MKPIILDLYEMSDSKEVYESKPNIVLALFIYLVLAIFLVAFIWMYFGKIDIVVKSEGVLRPSGQLTTVTNKYTGTIETVNIEDGQEIEKGDILYVIEHGDLLKQNNYIKNQLADITKELDNLQTYKKSIEDGVNYFNSENEEYYLRYRGFYINNKISEKDTDYKNEDGSLKKASVEEDINNELCAVIDRIKSGRKKKDELEINLDNLNSQIEKATVKAAKSGIISSNTELVIGDTLSAGAIVLTIIPDNKSSFKANIYVSDKDIGKLKEGMSVKFDVYALPSNGYGYLTGKISKISKDLKVNDKNTEGFYLVEASIDKNSLYDSEGKESELMAGMSCQAQIIIENKQILKFVLEKMAFLEN